jgi:hypothetical protein
MPHQTFKRWTADDIAKLKNLAQKQPLPAIAAELGRSQGATAVQAHKLGLSLRMSRKRVGLKPARDSISEETNSPIVGLAAST